MISRTKRGISLDMQARRASRVPGATPKRANHETRPTPGTANGAIVSSQTQPLHPRRRIRVATTGGARRSSCRAVWAGNDDVRARANAGSRRNLGRLLAAALRFHAGVALRVKFERALFV